MSIKTLIEQHRDKFHSSGIDDAMIERCGVFSANGELREILNWIVKTHSPGDGWALPYFHPEHTEPVGFCVRLDNPRIDAQGKVIKYETPRGAVNKAYFPPGVADLFADSSQPLYITEGPLKAIKATQEGFPCIGLNGVYGWSGRRIEREGQRIGKKHLLPELDKITWKDRHVYITFDSDAATKRNVRQAEKELARVLVEQGAIVHIVRLPGHGEEKNGLDDYLVKHGKDAFANLVENTSPVIDDDLSGDDVILTNYISRIEKDDEDKVRVITTALTMNQICERWNAISGNWPRRVGSLLFFDDAGKVRWAQDHIELFATVQGKGAVRWGNGSDTRKICFVSRQELFAQLAATAKNYGAVSPYPVWPSRADTYSMWRQPSEYAPTGEYLRALLGNYCPATDLDASLLRAMLLTFVWGGPPGQRPAFVLTGDDKGQQEVGKTAAVTTLSSLVGGAFEVQIGSYGDDLAKQLTSATAMEHRVLWIDNLTGVFRSGPLADLITASYIDGRPSHGRQTRRVNLNTWCFTTNDLAFSTDLATRVVVIRLRTPDRDNRPNWAQEVSIFIDDHRDEILADAIAALQGPRHAIISKRNRFALWCDEVLATDPSVNDILPRLQEGIDSADADSDDVALFESELLTRYSIEKPFGGLVQPAVLGEIWRKANHDQLSNNWVIRRLKAAHVRGKLTSLKPPDSRHHGADWVLVESPE